jgi:ArsR family transcriptional regulator
MAQEGKLLSLETVLKALADRTRLRIVGLLMAGEVCVCDIHESLGIQQPKTSRHLAYLRRTGLVETRKNGLWVHYRLAHLSDPVLQGVLDAVAHAVGHLRTQAGDVGRLARRIELTPEARVNGSGTCCSPLREERPRRPSRRARS